MAFKMDEFRNRVGRALRINNEFVRIMFAELLGTMFLVALGDGAVAQKVLSADPTVSTFLSVNFAYALAIAFGIYICGGVSGGHINPAVTFCLCFFGRCEWYKLPAYFIGQFVGAFFGSAIIFTTYYNALSDFDSKVRKLENLTGNDYWVFQSAGIFGTYPQTFLSVFGGFYDQIVGTAILLLVIFAVTDQRNMQVPKHLVPLLIGLGVGVIGMAYGYNCGYAINPARDLAPRLFTLIAGWGPLTFSYNGYAFFMAPVVGPFIGAILGGLLYQALVGIHWPVVYQAIRSDEQGQIAESGLSSPKGKIIG